MTATVLQLHTAPALTALDVAPLTDPRSYARGVDLVASRRASVTHQSPSAVIGTVGTVAGRGRHQVHLALGRRGLEHRCSCRVGRGGAFCEHLVALALSVDDGPGDDDVAEYEEDPTADWAAQANATVDAAEAVLAAGRAADVITFCDDALRCLAANDDSIPDRFAVHELGDRLEGLRRRARKGAPPTVPACHDGAALHDLADARRARRRRPGARSEI